MYSIINQNDFLNDINELLKIGLTEEEIEGYKEFFFEEYFPTPVNEKDIIWN